MSDTLTIARIAVPETVDAPDAAPFRAIATVANAVARHEAGHDHFDTTPEEMLPSWQDQTDRRQIGFAAESGGEIVGVATLLLSNAEGARTVDADVLPLPAHRGTGIEEALLDAVERAAADLGRPVVQSWTLHRRDGGGDRLPSPTGFGSIPLHDHQTQFMLRSGFTLGQVERNSVFDLTRSFDAVERLLADAERSAGPDYRVVRWTFPTPEEFKGGFAYAISRMSTDTPSGDLEWPEEAWDAARVERRDARLTASGFTVSVAAVQHVPTGRIVAYNELAIGADPTAPTHQWGTLVVNEHRGRRLGMIVKCANLLRWREFAPDSPRVSTFNAEENRHMLDINEAIGFVPASYAGAWKKVLDA